MNLEVQMVVVVMVITEAVAEKTEKETVSNPLPLYCATHIELSSRPGAG